MLFQHEETVSAYRFRLYRAGQLQDMIEIVDYEIIDASGYFSEHEGEMIDEDEISNILDPFYDKLGFQPMAAEIMDQC